MNSVDALAALRKLAVPAFTTADARALFGESTATASKTLRRLAHAGLLSSISHGVWALDEQLDPLVLPELLTAPAPSYVSLHTALYRRGIVQQIPAAIYVVTVGRTRRYATRAGTFSMHRIPPELFGGFEVLESGAKLATSEKAIIDFLYLSTTRSRLFARLPEIELPPDFDRRIAERWIRKIPSATLRALVTRRFGEWIAPHLPKRLPKSRRR